MKTWIVMSQQRQTPAQQTWLKMVNTTGWPHGEFYPRRGENLPSVAFRVGRAGKQDNRFNAQNFSDAFDDCQGRVPLAAFDPTNVAISKSSFGRQSFQRHPAFQPNTPNISAQNRCHPHGRIALVNGLAYQSL
jgi:hypothetical protein